MAQEGRVALRHFAATANSGSTPPGVLYIDGRACYPAPCVGAFAPQPWTHSKDIPCYPTPDYH